jgi:hypothetical protein
MVVTGGATGNHLHGLIYGFYSITGLEVIEAILLLSHGLRAHDTGKGKR